MLVNFWLLFRILRWSCFPIWPPLTKNHNFFFLIPYSLLTPCIKVVCLTSFVLLICDSQSLFNQVQYQLSPIIAVQKLLQKLSEVFIVVFFLLLCVKCHKKTHAYVTCSLTTWAMRDTGWQPQLAVRTRPPAKQNGHRKYKREQEGHKWCHKNWLTF